MRCIFSTWKGHQYIKSKTNIEGIRTQGEATEQPYKKRMERTKKRVAVGPEEVQAKLEQAELASEAAQ